MTQPEKETSQVAVPGKHSSSPIKTKFLPNSELGELNCFVVSIRVPDTGIPDNQHRSNRDEPLPQHHSRGPSIELAPTSTYTTSLRRPTQPKPTTESRDANEPRPVTEQDAPTMRHSTPTWRAARQHTSKPSDGPSTTEQQRENRAPVTTPQSYDSNTKMRVQHPYERDELDRLIDRASRHFLEAKSWEQFADTCRDPASDFHPAVGRLQHPAAPLLEQLRTVGVAVNLDAPTWTRGRRAAALARGSHKSAKEHIPFLREEYVGMIQKGHWTVLPARLLEATLELRLSPLGVVPQRERRPRTICDYSFFDVNDDTLATAPAEAMQFGKALVRILQRIRQANPRFGPVRMSKIDIANGFYRIWVKAGDIPKLAVLFPSRAGEEDLVALPMTLPMGWKESPPHFSTATETVADIANTQKSNNQPPAPHRLDALSESPGKEDKEAPSKVTTNATTLLPVPTTTIGRGLFRKPLAYWDVYVDDFIGLVQGNRWKQRRTKRTLLGALDSVFRELAADDNPHRQEPVSVKKMLKGDSKWTTRRILRIPLSRLPLPLSFSGWWSG